MSARAVVAGFYPPPFAGEPVHVKQLAQFLRGRGMVVQVLNLNRHASRSPDYESASGRCALLWKLLTLAEADAILHLHTNGHSGKSWLLILVAALAARLRGTSAIVTLHSGLLPPYIARFGRVRRGLAGWILASFRRVVCVNHEIQRAIEGLGIRAPDAVIIPAFLGVTPPPALSESDDSLIRDLRPLLVAVAGGEHDPEAGLAIVLRALQRLVSPHPGVGAVLLGWQVGARTGPLIEELGLAGRAICLGEVSHDRCLALLRAADVVIRSTFVDGDAITVREALALGVRVVASDTDFRPPGVTLFRKGDVSDLVDKVAQVLLRRSVSAPPRVVENDYGRELWRLYAELTDRAESTGTVAPPPGRSAASR